jgi:hypothetical protein
METLHRQRQASTVVRSLTCLQTQFTMDFSGAPAEIWHAMCSRHQAQPYVTDEFTRHERATWLQTCARVLAMRALT